MLEIRSLLWIIKTLFARVRVVDSFLKSFQESVLKSGGVSCMGNVK